MLKWLLEETSEKIGRTGSDTGCSANLEQLVGAYFLVVWVVEGV
jgi:hypothetical protein